MTMPASRPQPASFVTATLRVFDLSLGLMLWSRRSLLLAVLAAVPVALAAAIRLAELFDVGPPRGPRPGGPVLYGLVIWLLYIRFIVPVLGVFYGTSLIADEVDDRTLTYLFVRPIRRASVLAGRYLAFLSCASLLVLPSVVLVFFLIVPMRGGRIGDAFPALLADVGLLLAGLASYGAVFAMVGASLKRPLVIGLVFALGWEPAVLFFPGYLKRLTVAYYLQGIVPHAMPDEAVSSILFRVVRETPAVWTSLASLALLTAGALWLAGRAVARREYVLER
jgi:ABC-type transport system involved in multi-copper enzyme maturation permease subunit